MSKKKKKKKKKKKLQLCSLLILLGALLLILFYRLLFILITVGAYKFAPYKGNFKCLLGILLIIIQLMVRVHAIKA